MLAGGLEWADPTDLDGLREALKLADPEDRLGLPARDTLLVGDRLATDVRLAKKAGMACALILTGATTLDEALDSGDRPDYMIQGLGELLPSGDEPGAAARAGED